MPKAPTIEQQLLDLASTRSDPTSTTSREKLTKAISGKSNHLAGKAAGIILDANLSDFLPALTTAFDRFFAAGDKGCVALTPIASALYTFGHTDPAPFLRGIHHFQKEASYGPPVDVAAELRGYCALGLVRLGYGDVLVELAELLMDPEPQPRQMAARAIAYTGHEAGAMLLRMKVLAGDKNEEVIAECFTALMAVAPKKSLAFVARYFKSEDPALVESSALVIGSSKLPEAFALLRAEWESHVKPEPRRPLLLAIAMTRQPAAVEFLLERIQDDRPAPAADAITAMAIYKHDEAIKTRVAALISAQLDRLTETAFQKAFG